MGVNGVNKKFNESLSGSQRLALWITNHVGTMQFFSIIFIWTFSWLGWNIFAPKEYVFDSVPSCVFWLFISNMIQIFLMPLIMIGQNLQSTHSELRAEANFELSVKTSKEADSIHHHLHIQNEILKDVIEKIDNINSKNL